MDMGELHEMMVNKANDLFALCDQEAKGFITRLDMLRLQQELPLTEEQLEIVFDSLDHDGNGQLSRQEFTSGFGSFLGVSTTAGDDNGSSGYDEPSQASSNVYGNWLWNRRTSVGDGDGDYAGDYAGDYDEGSATDGDDHQLNGVGLRKSASRNRLVSSGSFDSFLTELDRQGLADDTETLRRLWTKLKHNSPDSLPVFEGFLTKMVSDVKRSKQDLKHLESTLKSRTVQHDEEMRRLYEEMEQQMRNEKQRIEQDQRIKEAELKEQLEKSLTDKDKQLQELIQKHVKLQSQLAEVSLRKTASEQEFERLRGDKKRLEDLLEETESSLNHSQSVISEMKRQSHNDKRERAMAALQVSEDIALEREHLVRELERLRQVNKQLLDERDEQLAALTMRANDSAFVENELEELSTMPPRPTALPHLVVSGDNLSLFVPDQHKKRGSFIGDYIGDIKPSRSEESDVEVDAPEDYVEAPKHMALQTRNAFFKSMCDLINEDTDEETDGMKRLRRGSSVQNLRRQPSEFDEDAGLHIDALLGYTGISRLAQAENKQLRVQTLPCRKSSMKRLKKQLKCSEMFNRSTEEACCQTDVPANSTLNYSTEDEPAEIILQPTHVGALTSIPTRKTAHSKPDRVFKVVFVGDSGVGKSSFIHQLCTSEFRSTFTATIGVDFQVKTLDVNDTTVVLQLWDTAGQERFRSITKQYFRKADGIVVMYDVTSEASFISVREWLQNAQECSQDALLLLVGNKLDKTINDRSRAVQISMAQSLAKSHGALFYEVSAMTGLAVVESVTHLASELEQKEDAQIETTVQLNKTGEADPKKKSCCG